MPQGFADAMSHYDELLRNEPAGLGDAACVTVLPGRREVSEVVADLGIVTRQERAMSAEALAEAVYEDYDPEVAVAWVLDLDGAVVLVELNGWAGSVAEVLQPLSRHGQVAASMYWCDANGANRLSLARDGEVESTNADYGDPSEIARCPGLAPHLPAVWATTADGWPGYRAGGLAAVEALTGFRLTVDHLRGPWSAVWFTPRTNSPVTPPGILGTADPELALALQNASWPAYRAAAHRLGEAVAAAGDVRAEPAVVTLLADLAVGRPQPVRPELRTLTNPWQAAKPYPGGPDPDIADPVWRRSLTGRVLMSLAHELESEVDGQDRTPYSWFEAPGLLGDRWTAFRADVLADLRAR